MKSNKQAISIASISRILGREEFSKRTLQEWREWLKGIERLADILLDEMNDSKYKSIPQPLAKESEEVKK